MLELAKKDKFEIVDVFRESQTAKEPGRLIFNKMLSLIEQGKAKGILSWHPDRLARNSVDGGRIIYLVDTDKIQSLKFPTFWFENTPQGKFMLNIAFGQSKYFVDNLSENVKRGLRQKVRQGIFPGPAPTGYLNSNHIIVPDLERFSLVKKIFEAYSTGKHSLKDLKQFGLVSRNEKLLSISNIQRMLSNPFYYGAFVFKEELYQGKHKPAISKKLFDKCQRVMKEKTRPQKRNQIIYAFRGLLKCLECGCSITSETHKEHNYYRCTKKRIPCSQPYVREENLTEQISKILQKVSLSSAWTKKMIKELNKEKEVQAEPLFAQTIRECELKLERLLDARLEGLISNEEYISKKQKILNQKIENEEKLRDFERKENRWLELCKQFILLANQAKDIALHGNLFEKKDFLKKIGSNLFLNQKEICFKPNGAWKILYSHTAERRSREATNSTHTTWLGRQDSNLRMMASKATALPLGDSPKKFILRNIPPLPIPKAIAENPMI